MLNFNPPFWLKNAHIQTILPTLVNQYTPNYTRTLIKDSLNESDIAIDTIGRGGQKAVVLFHGMEGSSQSHYARSLARFYAHTDLDFVVVHFRSCGGVSVSGRVFYNACDTAEISHALSILSARYDEIFAIGVSLGGNALAKYLGTHTPNDALRACAIICAPLDLASANTRLDGFIAQKIYTPYLLNPILKKAIANHLSDDEIHALKTAKRLSDFDEVFTAPRHGFLSKNDYYHKASALPNLRAIATPTLIAGALDDPFVGLIPHQNDVSASTRLHYTAHGGHVGFVDFNGRAFGFDYIARLSAKFFGIKSRAPRF